MTVADTFCVLPWRHVEIDNIGQIRACCINRSVIGNIREQTLEQAFQSPEMQRLRQQLATNQQAAGCDRCWRQEDQGGTSLRQRSNAMWLSEWKENPIPRIVSMDLKPGNLCNFRCRICGPWGSSQIAVERDRRDINQQARWIQEVSTWADQIDSIIPQLTNVDIYGGEPLLMPEVIKLLDKLSRYGENIRLHLNTNGSVWDDRLVYLWSRFREVDLALSIDDIGQRFELQRGGSWEEIQANVKKYLALKSPNVNVYVWSTVNLQNLLTLPDLLAWTDDIGISVSFGYLDGPAWVSIDNIPEPVRARALEVLTDPRLDEIRNRILQAPGSDGREFLEHMTQLDHRRRQDWRESHQELAKLLEKV